MSQYRMKRKGEEILMQILDGAKYSNNNHDIDWRGLKIIVKVRGKAGQLGTSSFTFSFFSKPQNTEAIYILVGLSSEGSYFWVLSGKEVQNKTSYYASIQKSVPYPELKQAIVDKAIMI